MNNMFPFGPQMFLPNQNQNNQLFYLEEEIKNIKQDLNKLKEKINLIEKNKKNDFLKKDDGFYMM